MSKHTESRLCVLSTGQGKRLQRRCSANKLCQARQNCGNVRPPLRGSLRGVKPASNTSPNGHWNERRTEKKGREKGIIPEAFLTPPRFFCFIGSIVSLWAYTTGAFHTACQSLHFGFISMQFPVSLTQPREPFPGFQGSSLSEDVLASFHRPLVSVLRSVTEDMPVLQGSCSCFGPPKASSLVLKQEHFPWSHTRAASFKSKESSWAMSRGHATHPRQGHNLMMPSEPTLNITHQ